MIFGYTTCFILMATNCCQKTETREETRKIFVFGPFFFFTLSSVMGCFSIISHIDFFFILLVLDLNHTNANLFIQFTISAAVVVSKIIHTGSSVHQLVNQLDRLLITSY